MHINILSLRRLQVFIVVACFLVLAGCTSSFLYNQIDRFIVWKVEDFVTLEKNQKQALRNDLRGYLDAMRREDLPRVAGLLNKVAIDVREGQITPQDIDGRYQAMLVLTDELLLNLVPLAQDFLISLNDAQIDELFESFDASNEEMYEEYSGETEERRAKNRNKVAIRTLQKFTGRLSKPQKALVKNALTSMEDASEAWFDNQQNWQTQLRKLLESGADNPRYREQLTQLMVHPRSLHAPEYRARVERNRMLLNKMLAELISGLSEKQRDSAVDELEGYAELLERMSMTALED